MYLSPKAFQTDELGQRVVTHEIAHYTHFAVMRMENARNLRMWFTVGLASFTAGENDRLGEVKSAYREGRIMSLPELSSYTDAQAYSSPKVLLFYAEGHSVFSLVDRRFGAASLSKFVLAASRRTTIEGAMLGRSARVDQ
jgi:hypothetical protein